MEQWLWGGGRTDRHRRGRPYLSATLLSRPKDTRSLAPGSECGRSYMGLLREAAAKIMKRGPSESQTGRSVPVRVTALIFFVTYANLQIRGSMYEQDHLQSCEARRRLGLRGKRHVLRAIPNPRGGSQGRQTSCERTGYTG